MSAVQALLPVDGYTRKKQAESHIWYCIKVPFYEGKNKVAYFVCLGGVLEL